MSDKAKKYEVNPGLKAILAEGKTSTFSLTNLFDSEDFKRDEEEQLNEPEDCQQFEGAPKDEPDDEAQEDETQQEDEARDDHHTSRQRPENRNQLRDEPIRESFFFSENDERFERLKFCDPNKIEKHNKDWNKKKEQLVMALARRRKSMKKTQFPKEWNRGPFNKDARQPNRANHKQHPKQSFKRKNDTAPNEAKKSKKD